MQSPRHACLPACCFLIGLALALGACTHAPMAASLPPADVPMVTPSTAKISFGTTVTLDVGHSVTFADGLKIVLDKVNDSRCPANVACVWAGELAPQLTLNGGNLRALQTLSMGTERARKQVISGYAIALVDARIDSITLVVTKAEAATGKP